MGGSLLPREVKLHSGKIMCKCATGEEEKGRVAGFGPSEMVRPHVRTRHAVGQLCFRLGLRGLSDFLEKLFELAQLQLRRFSTLPIHFDAVEFLREILSVESHGHFLLGLSVVCDV